MVEHELVVALAAVGGAVVGAVSVLAVQRVRAFFRSDSLRAHEQAQERTPPVELGETYEFGVTDFTDHHTGKRVAVGKVEGFVVFTEEVPESVSEGDVIRATISSFNSGRTSATATYEGR